MLGANRQYPLRTNVVEVDEDGNVVNASNAALGLVPPVYSNSSVLYWSNPLWREVGKRKSSWKRSHFLGCAGALERKWQKTLYQFVLGPTKVAGDVEVKAEVGVIDWWRLLRLLD